MLGIFDSGLGGLTVVKEVLRRLPGVRIIYFGDTARTPYGTKSKEVVTRYALEDAAFLRAHGAKAIVVACNTASTQAIDALRRESDLPVFDVVAPAVRAASSGTRIGVIGTRGTVGSGAYQRLLADAAPVAEVTALACPMFVPLIEEGWAGTPEAAAIARTTLRPLRLRRLDTLILGCTHYPFLRPAIRRAVGSDVRLVDPAREAVLELVRALKADPSLSRALRARGGHRFFVSDKTPHFAAIASRWLGRPVRLETASAE
jgi:glutamate racemase